MLKQYLSLKLAANILLSALGLLLLFHFLVLFGVIDSGANDQLETRSQILMMRAGAAILTSLMILMIAVRMDYLKIGWLKSFSQTAMWVIFVFLMLNLIRHLSSTFLAEKAIFIPITLALTICAYRLAMREEEEA